MALIRFDMPDLGEGLTAAEIVEWHASPGDRLVAEQPLVSVETDKAVVEIPVPFGATLRATLAKPGEAVPVGAPLAEFETGNTTDTDTGTVVGVLPAREAVAPPESPKLRTPPTEKAVSAMPAGRALARKHGIDLAALAGTGPGGAVTRADVLAAIDAPTANALASLPLTGARRAMALRMAGAREVIRATIADLVDVTPWFEPRADVLWRLARAMARGAEATPRVNAWFDAERLAMQPNAALHLALAVDTEAGLYVPVIRDVETLDAVAFRQEADRLIAAARSRRLSASDQSGATLSLSSFGTLGGCFAELVVSPPQVAILGAGRVFERYQRSGVQQCLPLSLSFDHRAITGGDAMRFLAVAMQDLLKAD